MRTAEVGLADARAAGRVANESDQPWSQLVVTTPTHLWRTTAGVAAGQTIDLASTGGAATASDDAGTRRAETGIERLAVEPGWEAILMDRTLATRLVRLQQVEGATIIAARSDHPEGPRYVLHVVRRDDVRP